MILFKPDPNDSSEIEAYLYGAMRLRTRVCVVTSVRFKDKNKSKPAESTQTAYATPQKAMQAFASLLISKFNDGYDEVYDSGDPEEAILFKQIPNETLEIDTHVFEAFLEYTKVTIRTSVEHDDEDLDTDPEITTTEHKTPQEAVRAYEKIIISKLDEGFEEDFDSDEDEEIESYHSVKSTDEIREQIANFNEALSNTSIKDKWLGQTLKSSRYWVCDGETGNFCLNKLAGYYPVSPVDYTHGTVDIPGPWMNGGSAKKKIESVTGKKFEKSDDTMKLFRKWIDNNLLPEAEDDFNFSKIEFLVI